MQSPDHRRDTPAYHRNIGPITEVLSKILPTVPGDAMEIGSGSGQHIVSFAKQFDNLTWWPTEFAPENIASIDAWRTSERTANVRQAVRLDASLEDWELGAPNRPPSELDAIFTANVIHISPWTVCTGIVRGASRHLKSGGYLIFYGPFFQDDHQTAPSNLAFDETLRSRDPEWGIRQLSTIVDLAVAQGFNEPSIIEMPANNLIVTFEKAK